jgi:hypothetical protein
MVRMMLWQVLGPVPAPGEPPLFCAGLVTEGDTVIDAAPILRRQCLGRTRSEVRVVARERGWVIRFVPESV